MKLSLNQELVPKFDTSAIRALQEYIWPGNVRELKNVIERAAIIFPKTIIKSNNVKRKTLLKLAFLIELKKKRDYGI